MATDVVFFVKAFPRGSDLPWPRQTRLVGLDLPAAFSCGGVDRLCSSGYRRWVDHLRVGDGRALPKLLERYAPDADGRVAFVGFSAAHGLLDPLAASDADRRDISAYILMDATFNALGSSAGKPGYVQFAADAADGDRLLVTPTANSGAGHMTGRDSWRLVWEDAQAITGATPKRIGPRGSMPAPAGGAWQLGDLCFWYDYTEPGGRSQIAHTAMGKLVEPVLSSYLIPYWSGELSPSWPWYLLFAGAAAGTAYGAYRLARR